MLNPFCLNVNHQKQYQFPEPIPTKDLCFYGIGANGFIECKNNDRPFAKERLIGSQSILGDGNGRVYTRAGQVIDPEQQRILGTLPRHENRLSISGQFSSDSEKLIVDPVIGRIFLLHGDRILVADYSTFVLLDTLIVPDISGMTGNLIRWGADGLAFRTSEQVIVFRCKDQWKPIPPADLSISIQHEPGKVTVGQPYTLSVTVTNNGIGTATGVTLTFAMPKDLKLVSSSLNKAGQVLSINGVLAAQVGLLKPKERAILTLVTTPIGTKKNLYRAVVRGNELDSHPENNLLEYELDNTKADTPQQKPIEKNKKEPTKLLR